MEHLQTVIELDAKGSHTILYEIKEALVTTERLLQDYFFQILQIAVIESGSTAEVVAKSQGNSGDDPLPTLGESVKALRILMDQKRSREQDKPTPRHQGLSKLSSKHAKTGTTLPSRSVTDTLLFRLIVALQLCLVRIDDAHFVITGFRRGSGDDSNVAASLRRQRKRKWFVHIGFCGGVLGITAFLLQRDRKRGNSAEIKEQLKSLAKVGTSTFLVIQLANQWQSGWMASKLVKSTTEIEDWQQQWLLVEYAGSTTKSGESKCDDDKSKRLIEYAKTQTPKTSTVS